MAPLSFVAKNSDRTEFLLKHLADFGAYQMIYAAPLGIELLVYMIALYPLVRTSPTRLAEDFDPTIPVSLL